MKVSHFMAQSHAVQLIMLIWLRSENRIYENYTITRQLCGGSSEIWDPKTRLCATKNSAYGCRGISEKGTARLHELPDEKCCI